MVNFIKKSKILHKNYTVGTTIQIGIRADEKKSDRIQYYEGLIISKQNKGISTTITLRKIIYGVGTEYTIPLCSPKIVFIKTQKIYLMKRSKLYYIRNLSGKAIRLKQKFYSN